MKKVYSEII